MPGTKKTIVILHGSLRENSSSAAVIRTAVKMFGDRVNIIHYNGTGQLPHFNDMDEVPAVVVAFRKLIADADGVLICTPEYAYGIPGTLKNALDWTVSSGEFYQKAVSLITASSQGEKGHTALLHVLTAISCKLSDESNLIISFIRSKVEKGGEVTDAATIEAIRRTIEAFIQLAEENGV